MTEPLLRVQSLHALEYCERLFFLEEVEELRVADAAVFAGRRLHQELDEGERLSLELSSPTLGLMGKLDALRRRDGVLVVTEQKRGRPLPGPEPGAWPSDQLQVAAYGMLLEEVFPGEPVECRVRYHAPQASVRVPLDDAVRVRVRSAIERAQLLRRAGHRPPVTTEERRCSKCSLAPVCLPEEERPGRAETPRLFPEHETRQVVHVTIPGARVGRAGEELRVTVDEQPDVKFGAKTVCALVVHGNVQVSTQAIAMCVEEQIGVHWFTRGGQYLGSLGGQTGSVHRRLRQFEALRDDECRLQLARRLVSAKVEAQLRFLLRGSRERPEARQRIATHVRDLRRCLSTVRSSGSTETLLGLEGAAAARYFSALGELQVASVEPALRWTGRSRRPPLDRFNALLGFFYGLVQRDIESAIVAVGLDPAFGFYHRPRGSTGPLVLDLMELFRVPLADMPVVASINRQTWDCNEDFDVASRAGTVTKVWLSPTGRRKRSKSTSEGGRSRGNTPCSATR